MGIGLNISNIGSKISYGGDDNSEFIPTNLRLGVNFLIPINEYNKFSIAADANKLFGADLSETERRRGRSGLYGSCTAGLLRYIPHCRYFQEFW